MSATDGFTDLEYSDYPAVDSDTRYIYRDVLADDIPYVNEYESLLVAVKTAKTESARTDAWNALNAFMATSGYTDHVEPVIMNAVKMQRLEDCILACQRFAKRQTQQWIVSDVEPDTNIQAVNDIWFKPDSTTSNGVTAHLMHQKTNNGYAPMAIANPNFDITEIKVVDELPSDASSHPTICYLVTKL